MLHSKLEKAYKLAVLKGLYRIASRILDIEISPSPLGVAHTDGSKIVLDARFVERATTEDLLFVAAHEYYHIVYDHARRAREKKFVHSVYNIACDLVINEHLGKSLKLKRPLTKGAEGVFLSDEAFKDIPKDCNTSEKIYHWLRDNKDKLPDYDMQEDLGENDADSDSRAAEANRADRLAEEGDERAKADRGREASKEIFDALGIDISEEANKGWVDLLTAMSIEAGRLVRRDIVYNYARPSRREAPHGIILPASRHIVARPKIDVYIDVSGSMGDSPNHILKGLRGILSHMIMYCPRFFTFDTSIREVSLKRKSISGGGGTDIKKVLNKIRDDKADLAMVITDCEDSVTRSDFAKNVVVVSNNREMADFITNDWIKVKRKEK